jgi:hypothetical protein
METKELIQLFQRFLDENGLWYDFIDWLEGSEDKKPTDLGFESDD